MCSGLVPSREKSSCSGPNEKRGTGPAQVASAEPVEQAAVVQHRHDLAHQAIALGDLADLRQPLKHHRVGAAQPELAGQHQPDRAAADDRDVGVADTTWRVRGHGSHW
jgi:hypothetical protein